MRILIVASYNKQRFAPFIVEQAETLRATGVEINYFGVVGKGIRGYLHSRKALMQKIREYKPDIIHAHYGLSGLLANLQRKVPVISTYHGSDINVSSVLCFSRIAMRLSAWSIFVSQRNVEIAGVKKRFSLIPCGIDVENFAPRERRHARIALGWGNDYTMVLFAGAFDNEVKNAPLAKEAVDILNNNALQPSNVQLLEMRGYSRAEIANLFYAADALLMTSHTEGSPQVIKEAMACGCPIVSVDVGDVAERIAGVDHCYIAERTPEDIAVKLNMVLQQGERTNGRERLIEMGLDNKQVVGQLIDIYENILSRK